MTLPFGKGKRFGSNWNGPVNAIAGGWQINVIEKITVRIPAFRGPTATTVRE